MKCPDCGGSGKYQPLIGPPENCTLCGGSGQAGVGRPGPTIALNVQWQRLTLCSRPHDGIHAGEWYTWFDDWSVPEHKFVGVNDIEYRGMRMLAVDLRGHPPKGGGNRVFADERPGEYDQLKAMADNWTPASGHPAEACVGPEVEWHIPVQDIRCFWHAWSKLSIRAIAEVHLHHANPGDRFNLTAQTGSSRLGTWFRPVITKA